MNSPVIDRVIWEPQPGSQSLALDARANIIVYTGTRGPGKTDAQLMRFRSRVGIGYGAAWRGVIFDQEYKNLDDIISKSKKWFPQFKDGAKFSASQGALKWEWPTGEALLLRVARRIEDYWDYHGHEYPFIGWNELTKYPTPELFDAMMSTNRTGWVPPSDGSIPPIPLEVFATTNPYGPGHSWVKRRFIDPAPYGKVLSTEVEVDTPGKPGHKTIVSKRQVAIFGSWMENKYLDPTYIATLMNERNKARKKAWLTGDWNIVAGGALDDIWDASVHVVPRFEVPKGWRIDRAFDWGSSHPFYVGWFAESDGTEAMIYENGKAIRFCPPRGSIVLIHEWYGCEPDQPNVGIKLSSPDIARGILAIEERMLRNGWISSTPSPGPADNQIANKTQSDELSIGSKMALAGVTWLYSNKAAKTRANGLQLIRDRLSASVDWASKGEPSKGLFFMAHCRSAIATIPQLPRDPKDPDDVDTNAEDHPYDVVRYRVLHSELAPEKRIEMSFV